MIVVISQAWARDADAHADAYVHLSEGFATFFADHPRYRGRLLVRDSADGTHFTHLRFFDDLAAYEECTQRPGYVAHTELMYEHLAPYEGYPRQLADVVLADGQVAEGLGLTQR